VTPPPPQERATEIRTLHNREARTSQNGCVKYVKECSKAKPDTNGAASLALIIKEK
jgi:hypothetical protein